MISQAQPKCFCENSACATYNGMSLCHFHYMSTRCSEECAICLNSLGKNGCGGPLMLTCGHMFHLECLEKYKVGRCPLCRKNYNPSECRVIFGTTIVNPLVEEVYALPAHRVDSALDCMRRSLRLCARGDWFTGHLLRFLEYLEGAYDVMMEAGGISVRRRRLDDVMYNIYELLVDIFKVD